MKTRIAIASDHGGYKLKEKLAIWLVKNDYQVFDFGTNSENSVDYPIYAGKVVEAILDFSGVVRKGILICGTGIGISIAANRYKGIRAALCYDEETAQLSREHNDSNILVLGGRKTGVRTAYKILSKWLETEFQGDRHESRIDLIDSLPLLEERRKKIIHKYVNESIKNHNKICEDCIKNSELPPDIFTGLPHDLLYDMFNEDICKSWEDRLGINE